MKETKFTPAPWVVFTDVFNKSEVRNAISEPIAAYTSMDDANLISKAPNMYNKLWSVKKLIEEMLTEGVDERYTVELHEIHEEIENLLKSARGE